MNSVKEYTSKRLALIEGIEEGFVDPGYEKEGKIWKLHWGYHDGTMMGRDIGDPYYFNTLEECKRKIIEIEKDMNKRGYKIGSACAYLMGVNNKCIEIHRGTYYSRY